MTARLKIKSLSDFNGEGEATLTLARADGETFFVTVTDGDLEFVAARRAMIKLKQTETKNADAKAKLA